MTGDSDFMAKHFGKARALAEWLLYRFNMSLNNWPESDARHGVTAGGDEGDGFVAFYEGYVLADTPSPLCRQNVASVHFRVQPGHEAPKHVKMILRPQ